MGTSRPSDKRGHQRNPGNEDDRQASTGKCPAAGQTDLRQRRRVEERADVPTETRVAPPEPVEHCPRVDDPLAHLDGRRDRPLGEDQVSQDLLKLLRVLRLERGEDERARSGKVPCAACRRGILPGVHVDHPPVLFAVWPTPILASKGSPSMDRRKFLRALALASTSLPSRAAAAGRE